MALKFSRVVSPIDDMKIWSASSEGFSFVIRFVLGYSRRFGCRRATSSFPDEQTFSETAGISQANSGDLLMLSDQFIGLSIQRVSATSRNTETSGFSSLPFMPLMIS
jgi:hypothetical protein